MTEQDLTEQGIIESNRVHINYLERELKNSRHMERSHYERIQDLKEDVAELTKQRDELCALRGALKPLSFNKLDAAWRPDEGSFILLYNWLIDNGYCVQESGKDLLAKRDLEQRISGAKSFKDEVNASIKLVFRSHIDGVFGVWESRQLRQQAQEVE